MDRETGQKRKGVGKVAAELASGPSQMLTSRTIKSSIADRSDIAALAGGQHQTLASGQIENCQAGKWTNQTLLASGRYRKNIGKLKNSVKQRGGSCGFVYGGQVNAGQRMVDRLTLGSDEEPGGKIWAVNVRRKEIMGRSLGRGGSNNIEQHQGNWRCMWWFEPALGCG